MEANQEEQNLWGPIVRGPDQNRYAQPQLLYAMKAIQEKRKARLTVTITAISVALYTGVLLFFFGRYTWFNQDEDACYFDSVTQSVTISPPIDLAGLDNFAD